VAEIKIPRPSGVLVVGEALVDVLSAPDGARREAVGGSPANVALGLGRQGIPVALLTALADDERGRRIIRHLAESGVDVLPESLTLPATSTATATIDVNGQAEYTFDVTWPHPSIPTVLAPLVLHTGSLAAFLQPGAEAVLAHIESHPAPIVTFDPNIRPSLIASRADAVQTFERFASCATTIKLSEEDAAWLYPGRSADVLLDAVLALGCRFVVMTRGVDGSILATDDARVHVPAASVRVADTVGAGDTYMASLIGSIVRAGDQEFGPPDLSLVGRRAAHASGITVSRDGADLPWASDLIDLSRVWEEGG
jgi:fructokinase